MRKNINRIIKSVIIVYSLLGIGYSLSAQVVVTTNVIPPISAFLNRALNEMSHRVLGSVKNNNLTTAAVIRIRGKIIRDSPTPFTISLKKDYLPNTIPLNPGEFKNLTSIEVKEAFGNLNESNLDYQGITLDELKEGINYKLPDGIYRICLFAEDENANPVSNDGCSAMINICYSASAPQFTQPVNNLNINSSIPTVRPASPLIFTWTPPQSTCGFIGNSFMYDLEIRELLNSQTVNDAILNPSVFIKTSIPSTTFLLDTNLYKGILEQGKKYVIRVRARDLISPSASVVENFGYSRPEAFHFGNDINDNLSASGENNPAPYVIPFVGRRTNFWDSIYTAFQSRARGDTLVPVKEYIALMLTENGIAYNLDAIEILLALNPWLKELKAVKISRNVTLPVFTKVSESNRQKFDVEFEANLQPDIKEANTFKIALDTLQSASVRKNLPANTSKIVTDLEPHLNAFFLQVHSINKVTVNLVNKLLSRLLSVLQSPTLNEKDLAEVQTLVSGILELTTASPAESLSLQPLTLQLRSLLCYYNPAKSRYASQRQMVNQNVESTFNSVTHYFLAKKQLLSFDVVVWRYSKEIPSLALADAPDLNGVFRVFQALPALYNERNPEINATGSAYLASTAPVSLPFNSSYYIWAQNMRTRTFTKPQKVEVSDAFLLASKKNWPNSKNYKIIIKVD